MYLERYRTGSQRIDLGRAGGNDISIDGVFLEEMGLWPTSITLGAATATLSTSTAPGRHGVVDLTLEDAAGGAFLSTRTLTIGVATDAGWDETRDYIKPDVGALNGKSVDVWCEPLAGTMTGRCSVGEWTDGWGASTCELAFTVGPLIAGDEVEVELAEGETAFTVGGNRPAWPTLALTPVDGATSISIADGSGHTLEYNPGTVITAAITVDCESQELRAGGSLVAPTIESDYPQLVPGTEVWTLANCTGTLAYQSQTLI